MLKVQKDIEDFHKAIEQPNGDRPGLRDIDLRAALISEEVRETLEAMTGQQWEIKPTQMAATEDLAEAIDGIIDSMVVLIGSAVTFGVDLEPFWEDVQRANMAKAGGPVRKDGKRLRPEGWVPPETERLLAEQMGEPND